MKNLTHKEKLQYLKKYDPITYYELTSDPCGSGDSSTGCFPIVATLAIVLFIVIIIMII